MSIIRNKGRRFFSSVDSTVIRNGMLSLPALGLLITLLDRADAWAFRPSEIARSLCQTPDAIQPLLDEMLRMGFLVKRFDRYGMYYDLIELPPPNHYRAYDDAQSAGAPQKAEPPKPKAAPNGDGSKPKEEPGEPMSDERIAYWMDVIREKFPIKNKART